MGNYNTRTVRFLQSPFDFPCPITLGRNKPSFGLHRYKQGLRFHPPDDEAFTLRGDNRRLVYKGRRRAHRFTILGDGLFEYDCILLREPESNVVSIRMEGAENFDFFRQPDYVPDQFLKGSYAVYKKETLIGEGTGKLCHIHRPEIIDARGRRCWGDLLIAGNCLYIIIPEKWLGEAVYPVIVDPTVGTTTVGSQYKHIWEAGEDPEPLMFELSMPVNRFLLPETLNGSCTAFFYTNSDDYEAGGRPVLYSDNGNIPVTRLSAEEGLLDLRVVSGKPAGWRNTTFRSNTSISSGSYVWFGMFCEFYWMPRFDYGSKCYTDWWWDYDVPTEIPNTYPIYYANYYEDFRLSMYFTYTSAQNYVRTITQGVTLLDKRKFAGEYKRDLTQIVKANSAINRIQGFFLQIQETVKTFGIQSFSTLFLRYVKDTETVSEIFKHIGAYVCGLYDKANIEGETKAGWFILHKLTDTVNAAGSVFRGLILLVRIFSKIFARDYIFGRFLKARQELVLKSAVCREIVLESKIE